MFKNLVVGGCSFTQDYRIRTWPSYLAEKMNWQLVNAGARGAGMDFVSKRLMLELTKHDPARTAVVVMLPSSDRFDLYVDSTHPLKKDLAEIASWQGNDYPELVNLDGSKSIVNGYSLTGGQPRGYKSHWYKYFYNTTFSAINYWFDIIALQNYLKLQGFSYCFTSVYNLDDTIEQDCNRHGTLEFNDMLRLVDWDNFVFYKKRGGFLDFVRDNDFAIINNHAVTMAHSAWVQSVLLPHYV